MSVRQLGEALAAGLMILTASACGGDTSTDGSRDAGGQGRDQQVEVQGVELRPALKPWSTFHSRYAFLTDPRVMAHENGIDLVGVGSVVDFRPGPVYFAKSATDPNSQPQVVLEVRMSQVTHNSVGQPGASAYLLLEGGLKPQRYREAIPPGTTVGIYAERMSFGDDFVTHRGAGRPAGVELWQPAAQGLIVPGEGGVAYPVINRIQQGKTLADVMPPALSIGRGAENRGP